MCVLFTASNVCVLPDQMLDDGVVDCDDSSDEMRDGVDDDKTVLGECLSSIAAEKNWVPDKRGTTSAIFYRQLCDGTFDCADLSDECLCADTDYFTHTSASNACRKICYSNSTVDVDKNSACHTCTKGRMLCDAEIDRGKCIPLTKLCDNVADCEDRKDEKYCTRNNSEVKIYNNYINVTKHGMMKCPYPYLSERYKEIPVYGRICDGVADCLTLEDECGNFSFYDLETQMMCSSRKTPSYCALHGYKM